MNNKVNRRKGLPGIPPEAFGPPIPLTAEELAKGELHRNELIAEAIGILRKAGATVELMGCRGTVKILHDDLEIAYEDDRVKVAVEGHDISDSVLRVSVVMGPGNYPAITVTFGVFPWNINEDLDPDEQQKRMSEVYRVLAKKR